MRARLDSQRGMTLIEVMVTVLVVCVGTLATLGTYAHFSGATNTARQRAVLTSVAQREIEQLKPIAYGQLGMASSPPGAVAAAAAEAPRTGPAASEPLVPNGVVRLGGDAFSYRGAKGRIYRYVTERSVTCSDLEAQAQSQVNNLLGVVTLSAQTSVKTSLSGLCAGLLPTKRLTVVVVPTDGAGNPSRGVTISTIRENPNQVSLAPLTDGLSVKPAEPTATPPSSSGESITTQPLYLTDTRCSSTTRATPIDHATADTSQDGFTCTASGPAPTLLTTSENLGLESDPVRDFSTDILHLLTPGGLVLQRDTRGGSCTSPSNVLTYSNAETLVRKKSLHTWASTVPAAVVETPTLGGRASLTLYTSTASGVDGPGRLCVTVRRSSNGNVIGASDFQLSSWPGSLTQLVTAFELTHVALVPGERLLLTLRVPSDSGSDLRIVFDHAKRPSNLALTLLTGKTL